jgi:hypothetical protein
MIAKNAGIRRARGEFILATNIDILFSDELMQFISGRNLGPGKMYRIDRHDVMSGVPMNASVDEQLAYCGSHLIRVNAREGTFRLGKDGARVPEKSDIAKPQSGLTLGGGWFPPEKEEDEIFRWVSNDAEVIVEWNAIFCGCERAKPPPSARAGFEWRRGLSQAAYLGGRIADRFRP